MFGTVRDILIHTTEESIAILLSLSSILFIFLVGYWQYNRRRFRKLSHQIPAGVVKDYLDSVIHNSSALKSSLLLGGNGAGNASVVPIEKLSQDNAGGENFEELSRKNAEIAELRNGISIKDRIIAELENKLEAVNSGDDNLGLSGESKVLQNEVERLKKELQEQGSGSSLSKDELNKLIQERDSLRDSLKEYEIIEDDLANIKYLKEENERYRKAIEEMNGTLPTDVRPPSKKSVEKVPKISERKEKIKQENKNVVKTDNGKSEDNSNSEELLKEFEKMLG